MTAEGQDVPRENRGFLRRVIRYLAAEAGIRQFLDIGTGLPATSSVHEVAQQAAPPSRVVYVDNDPLVLVHAQALLTSAPEGHTAYIEEDLRRPEAILSHPVTREVLDFGQPLGLVITPEHSPQGTGAAQRSMRGSGIPALTRAGNAARRPDVVERKQLRGYVRVRFREQVDLLQESRASGRSHPHGGQPPVPRG